MKIEKQDVSKSFHLPSVVAKEVRLFVPQNEHEREWLSNSFRQAWRKEVTLYYVRMPVSSQLIGLFTVSLDKPDQTSSWMIINYLYVMPQYRGLLFDRTPFRASELIVAEIAILAQKVSDVVNLDLLALQLAHQKLQSAYTNMGFVPLNRPSRKRQELWMAISLDAVG